jgi:pilus assembly protein CpaF
MVGMAGANLTAHATRQQICSAITVVVQVTRLTDGARKIVSLQEITGMEGDIIAMQEIFRFERTGVAADGRVLGHFRASGVRPRFADRLRLFGAQVADTVYDPDRVFE